VNASPIHVAIAWVLLGAGVGSLIGVVDAVETTAAGHTLPYGLATTAGFLLMCTVFAGALGCATGALIATVLEGARRLGFRWSWEEGARFRGWVRLPAGLACAAAGALVLLLLVWLILNLSHERPLGYEQTTITTAILVAGLPSIILTAWLGSHLRRLRAWMWAGFSAIFYLAETQIVYPFSKYGPAADLYTLLLFASVIFAIVAIAAASPRLFARLTRSPPWMVLAVVAIAFPIILLGAVLPMAGPPGLGLLVLERTRLSGRVAMIFAEPSRWSPDDALLECPPPTPRMPKEPEPRASRFGEPLVRGVVVVFVDALRADRIGRERDGRSLTPNLEALAVKGARFDRAYTTSPATQLAFLSIMASNYPKEAGRRGIARSLPRLLDDSGAHTMMASLHPLLRAGSHMFADYREFGDPEHNKRHLTGANSAQMAIEMLSSLSPGQPFFLLAHFYDPHEHYLTNSMFDLGGSLSDRYDAEVGYADYWIGKVLGQVEALGLSQETAVMVISDHGEELGEHGYFWHRLRLYEESARIVMLLSVPRVPARAVARPVSLVDVAPTVLDLLGAEIPPNLLGSSLVPEIIGKHKPAIRDIFMHSAGLEAVAVVRNEHKVIVNRHNGLLEHYDLASDPMERRALDPRDSPIGRQLTCAVAEWMTIRGL
jgi:hypothetical protein